MFGRPHWAWTRFSQGSMSEGEGTTWFLWYSTSHEPLFQDEFTFYGRLLKDKLDLSLTHQLPLSPCVVCPKNIFIFIFLLYIYIYYFFIRYLFTLLLFYFVCGFSSFETCHVACSSWSCRFECWTLLPINSRIPPLPFSFWKFPSLTFAV